jgi:hypothetical protein
MALLGAVLYAAGLASGGELDREPGPEHGKINTSDPSPVDPGHFELEFFYTYTHATRAFENDRGARKRGSLTEHAPSVALTIGAIKDLDVNVSFGYVCCHDAEHDHDETDDISGPHDGDGPSDTAVGMRYRFLQNERLSLEFAYLGGVTIPTGTHASHGHVPTGQEFWSWDQAIVVTKDWGTWTANAELGYSLPFGDERGASRGTLTANVAAGYQVLRWLQPEAELNYSNGFSSRGPGSDALAATAGLVMPLSGRLRVNAGVQHVLTGRNADRSTTFTVAVKLAW